MKATRVPNANVDAVTDDDRHGFARIGGAPLPAQIVVGVLWKSDAGFEELEHSGTDSDFEAILDAHLVDLLAVDECST